MKQNSDIPIQGLADFLDAHCLETRQQWREMIKDSDIFNPQYDLSLRDQKELALERLKEVAKNKLFSVKDFKVNPLRVFANHEMAGYVDGSMATKMTVQLNLFGGTVYTLGTERHLEVAEGVDNMSTIGCFALTELGFGNNAVQMETTAHYNDKDQTFSINSPTVLSQKYWITNGAYHCNYAIVFAQLIMPGNKNEGVNAFLVRVRAEDGQVKPGVFIEDMGCKFGLNGVDNGRLKFTNVVIPREALLNQYSDVNAQGIFSSKIKNLRQRFLKVADRLLSGRICIASMMMSATKGALLLTLRYGQKRLAMGNSGKSDTPISDFGLFQNQIYPLLARTIILNTGFNKVKEIYADTLLQKRETDQFIVCLCCAVKPIITWNSRDVGTTVTERVGGQGYLSINKVSEMLPFAHSGITAEGDNGVLMQKTAKELLVLVQKGTYETPTPKKSRSDLNFSSHDSYIDLLRQKEKHQIEHLQNETAQKMAQGQSIYDIWMKQDNDVVQDVARSFGERMLSEFATERIFSVKDSQLFNCLIAYLKLHLSSLVLKEIGWYLLNNYITSDQAKQIHSYNKKFIKNIHQFALQTVNSFGIPEDIITAPMAKDYEKYNTGPNNGKYIKAKL